MKTFKILNHTLDFDEGVIDYVKIMQDANSYKLKFNDRYMARPKKNINSLEEFVLYVQELYNNGFSQEYMKLSEELVNLYIKYGIYDMPKDMIQALNVSSLNRHLKNLEPILDEITTFSTQVKQGFDDIETKWEYYVNDAIQGHYFDVYSSSYSDILLNDYFNHKEEKRVEKKRQQLYNENVGKTKNDYISQIIPLCYEYINKIEQLIYNDVMQTIDAMYKKCAMDLVAKAKIKPFGDYTNSLKSNAILDNINKIDNKEIKKEQLVNALQMDILNPLVHLKIIEYITDEDIQSYIELVKFFKLENMIFYFYFENCANGEQKNILINKNCLTILKSVKDTLNMGIITKEINNTFIYTDDTFAETIFATKIYFECLKNIFGTDDKFINEKEQNMFIVAIKEASKGTNLVYDRSISHLDYNYLCEFWEKARNQRNATIKRQEITQNISNSFANWVKKHIKSIIIFIIIIAFFHWISKDTDNTNNTNNTNKQVVNYDTYIQNTTNSNHSKNTSDDYTITTDDLQLYQKNNSYVPGKTNPFASYE